MAGITYPTISPAGLGGTANRVRRLSAMLRKWSARSAGRAELARMSAAELKDLGVSPEQASWEAGKAPWQP